MAVVQLRHPTEGRAYYDRKVAAGKTPMEAMRCLKRRLSDIVYHQMMLDHRVRRAGPGRRWKLRAGSSWSSTRPGTTGITDLRDRDDGDTGTGRPTPESDGP